MKKLFILASAVALLTASTNAYASDSKTLEDRLYGCLESAACPASLKLELLNELHADMGSNLRQISTLCKKKDYEDCISSTQPEVKEWHRINDRMLEMMAELEGNAALIAKENKK